MHEDQGTRHSDTSPSPLPRYLPYALIEHRRLDTIYRMNSLEGWMSSTGHVFNSGVQLDMLSQIRIFNTVTGDNIDTPVDAWARDGPFSFSLLPHRELVLASQK